MRQFCNTLAAVLLASLGVMALGPAQTPLTFPEAVRIARGRNGALVRANAEIRAAKARVDQQKAAFYPTVTPRYAYTDTRNGLVGTQSTTGGRLDFVTQGAQVAFAYTLFDTGQRQLALSGQRAAFGLTEANAIVTLRSTLLSVEQQYLETLRAQELLRTAESTRDRAKVILDQTELRARVGDVARIQILQARTDFLNAEVSVVQAQNRVTSNAATLRALVGIEDAASVPTLEGTSIPDVEPEPRELETVVQEGLAARPDLAARRYALDQQRQAVRLSRVNASFQFSIDANYVYSLTDRADNSQASLVLSYPLFDGGLRRAQARESQALFDASEADLVQARRDARAEIETAYNLLTQNARRTAAATQAVETARQNYEAARQSQRLGAGTLVDVTTAQLSLVTSETNLIEAKYDELIASLQLRVATGRSLPGEDLPRAPGL